MALSEYFTVVAPGDIRLKGTRIGIETVLYDFIHRGMTPEAIADEYPSITLEQVYATITYYLREKEHVSRYLASWLKQGEQRYQAQVQSPSAVALKLRRAAAQRRAAGAA